MRVEYLLLGLTAFSGLIAGSIIAFMAKEELKQGKRYFLLMQKIILLLILVFVLNKLQLQLPQKIIIYIPAIIAITIGISTKLAYPLMAMALFIAKTPEMAALIFIYGLPTAAIEVEKRIKENKIRTTTAIAAQHLTFILILIITSFF